jgi:methylmalonyl-CoA mutase N-terminal domain/subunit
MGGTQSLHTNSFDEALALPSENAATIALRTQQVLGYESGVADAADPLGGSWMVESLTDEIEVGAREYLDRINGMGGAVEAIEQGWMKAEIEDAAYKIAQGIDSGERVIVGLNKFVQDQQPVDLMKLDPELERRQIARLRDVRANRDQAAVDAALKSVSEAAKGSDNLLYPMREALAAYATLGEVSDALREVFGEYEPTG